MNLLESIELALTAVKNNKMRSFLTMLGIIIGISSVITISAIGASAKGMIEDTLKGSGLGYLYINPNWEVAGNSMYGEELITREEADKLKERMGDELAYYAPYGSLSGEGRNGRQKANLNILGVASTYARCVPDIVMEKGRFISDMDIAKTRKVMVIDTEAAEYFYGNSDSVGKTLQLSVGEEQEEFYVIGVYSRKKSKLEMMFGGGSNFQTYVPYSITCGNDYETYYLECYVDTEDIKKTGQMMADFFTAVKKQEPNYYTYSSAAAEMEQINEVLDILSLAIGAIAAISLLVGGIGIMNIMLVSVTERTREIGTRKALGARTGDILWQFLIESMILSLIGGIVGILLGIGVAGIAAAVMEVRLVLEPKTIVIAVIFSALVGMVFGLFPARKAAAKDPIEALRYE